jgi:hypothetical protein
MVLFLEQGLKAMAGRLIQLPRRTAYYLDRDRLAFRFERFKKFSQVDGADVAERLLAKRRHRPLPNEDRVPLVIPPAEPVQLHLSIRRPASAKPTFADGADWTIVLPRSDHGSHGLAERSKIQSYCQLPTSPRAAQNDDASFKIATQQRRHPRRRGLSAELYRG